MQRMDPNKIETPLLSQKDMADKIALIKKKKRGISNGKISICKSKHFKRIENTLSTWNFSFFNL